MILNKTLHVCTSADELGVNGQGVDVGGRRSTHRT